VRGYEGRYEVSSQGRVRSLDYHAPNPLTGGVSLKHGRILARARTKYGYLVVSLGKGRQVFVHRLVAEAFLSPSELPAVNHLNFQRDDDRVENLEWCSHRNNSCYSRDAGRFGMRTNPHRGARINPSMRRRLTPEAVEAIRRDRTTGLSYAKIGAQYGVSGPTVYRICAGLSWV